MPLTDTSFRSGDVVIGGEVEDDRVAVLVEVDILDVAVAADALVVADAMQLEPVFVTPFLMIPLICGLLLLLLFAPVSVDQ